MATSASVMGWSFFWVFSLLCFHKSSEQWLGLPEMPNNGICKSMFCNSLAALKMLDKCVTVVGNLHVLLVDEWRREKLNIKELSFPNLREVTGFMLVYRVRDLESLGHLFPNLTRIRGESLFFDYALTIHDNEGLKEVGLYSLIKIDRGGVAITGNSKICYTDSVDWEALAPGARHVVSVAKIHVHCNTLCTCSTEHKLNRCWNMRKCQRFLQGPDAEHCHPECLGCRKTNPNQCSLCKNYTYKNRCVSECPNNTLSLLSNKYCITEQECRNLDGWNFNSSCVLTCPVDYVKRNLSGVLSCEKCTTCQETCGSQAIQSLEAIQRTERCVYVNGSLTIHIGAGHGVMRELEKYLSRIREVEDYIVINGSTEITSLRFFKSLKKIGGRMLTRGNHSLIIESMPNIQTLFSKDVMSNLKVERGHLGIKNNPMLCVSDINKLLSCFPVKNVDIDIPYGFNGYAAQCNETLVDLKVTVVNATSALVRFITSKVEINDTSTVLYTRLSKTAGPVVPESCSQSEWIAIPVTSRLKNYGWTDLFHLRPASTYAICIETVNSKYRTLSRTKIINFTTGVGKPEPPFIKALKALSSEAVSIRWVDHLLYKNHITHYELHISLIEIETKDIFLRDHCKKFDEVYNLDPHRHAKIMDPPLYYEKDCNYVCGIHPFRVSTGVDEYFDVCSSLEEGCNTYDEDKYKIPRNETYNSFVKSLVLNISAPKKELNVTGLAPFSDYRFTLRSCSSSTCSRSARSVIRTFALQNDVADKPKLLFAVSNQPGYVSVKWNHPDVTNGPILSYFIEVTIDGTADMDIARQVWCLPSNITNVHINPEISYQYFVKVCSNTLAFTYTCSNETRIEIKGVNTSVWWTGMIFGVLLYLTSLTIGLLWKRRVQNDVREHSDNIPLVDFTSMYRIESEPPVVASDFTPLYLLRDPD